MMIAIQQSEENTIAKAKTTTKTQTKYLKPWFGHPISSTGPSVSPFVDFFYFIIHLQASLLFLDQKRWLTLSCTKLQNQFFWTSTVAGSSRITNIISMPNGHYGVSNRAGHEWLISENSDYSCQQYVHFKLLSGKLAARRPERNCRLWIVSQSTSSLQQTPLIKKDSRPCSPLNGHLADKAFQTVKPLV